MKEKFIDHKFNTASLELIKTANGILNEYQAMGYRLSLRQLYYQLVARDYIENSVKVRAELEGVLLILADMKECAPVVRLRIQQGIRRSGLKDLLHPALEDLDRMMADVNDAQSQVHAAMQRLME